MARTIRRQPVQLSTSSSNYPQSYYFNQAQFKGISTEQNDITIDQETFADAKNMYIDENGVLVSRLPFKFDGTDAYIVERWDFGRYHLVLQRFLCTESGGTFTQVEDTTLKNLYFVFKMTCLATDVLDEYTWSFPVAATGLDYFPEVTCSQVEDKIFVWFAGIDFLCFNTITSIFEDAGKYIYLPIREFVSNGVSTSFESENFLTQSYRRRHQLSAVSEINYNNFLGKQIDVYQSSEYLYELEFKANAKSEELLLHPSYRLGHYCVDCVETARATIFLHYYPETDEISISFDTGAVHKISKDNLTTQRGEPFLSKDGLCIITFTSSGICKYELPEDNIENGSWKYISYPDTVTAAGYKKMVGYFETADVYTYIAGCESDTKSMIVYQRSGGASGFVQKTQTIDNIKFSDYTEFRISLYRGGQLERLYIVCRGKEVTPEKSVLVGRLPIVDTETESSEYKMLSHKLLTPLRDCGIWTTASELYLSGIFANIEYTQVVYKFWETDYKEMYYVDESGDSSNKYICRDVYSRISDKYKYHYQYEQILPEYRRKNNVLENGGRLILHALGADGVEILSANIWSAVMSIGTTPILRDLQPTSGSTILCRKYAGVVSDYLNNDYSITKGYDETSNILSFFEIKKLRLNPSADEFDIVDEFDNDALIRDGDIIVLEATNKNGINKYIYPDAPNGWKVGDDWPDGFPPYKPCFVEDGVVREWNPGDPLPVGPVKIYGSVKIGNNIKPLLYTDEKLLMLVDGELWTSEIQTDTLLELDERVNIVRGDGLDHILVNKTVPSHTDLMNEYYLSYDVNNEHLLEVTEGRRDEKTHNDFLLYLPKKNEQKFSSKITALHHLSDSEMGVFTETDIWYISTGTLNDTVVYTKPIRSKIPTGLRDGDEVVTALDGQAVIFPSERGIVALAPQDFVATTEKTLSYISDPIQSLYQELYKNDIRIDTYKYFLLFHRRLGRNIIAFDTRNSSWWRWSTPYPISSLLTNNGLRPLLQIDFPGTKPSLLGVPYILRNDIAYADDVIENSLNGDTSKVYENAQVGERTVYHRAEPIIDWWFTSQKLHFNQINNYKSVKSINLNLNESAQLKLCTKAYRDMSHPEQDDVFNIKVNEIRTFVKRFNLMHVTHFQYRLENDRYVEVPQRFKLNSLSIKYEVKERVR